MKIFFSADLEKVPPFVLLILQFNIYGSDSPGREFWPKCGPFLKKKVEPSCDQTFLIFQLILVNCVPYSFHNPTEGLSYVVQPFIGEDWLNDTLRIFIGLHTVVHDASRPQSWRINKERRKFLSSCEMSLGYSNISFHESGGDSGIGVGSSSWGSKRHAMNQEQDEDTERRHDASQFKASPEVG